MEKMIGKVVEFVDGMLPGSKTYLVALVGIGALFCQMKGYHQFSNEFYGMLGFGGLATAKMGMDRKKK